MTGKLKIGVVGCGEISEQFHLPILGKLLEFDVQWLCDRRLDHVRQIAQRFGIKQAFGSLDECPDVDCVLIATPVGSRMSLLEISFRRGWHAFCEKPFALGPTDHLWMLDSAERRGLVLSAGFMRRFYWATRTSGILAREFLREGSLRIMGSDCQRMKRSFHGGNWYLSDPNASGGGFLMEAGSHLVDQMLSILGAIDLSIDRVQQQSVGNVDFETLAVGKITNAIGQQVCFDFALSRLTDLWSGISLSTDSTKLEMTISPGSAIVLTSASNGVRTVLPAAEPATSELIGAYSSQLLQFARRVRESDVRSNPEMTGILTTRFIAECYERCRANRELVG